MTVLLDTAAVVERLRDDVIIQTLTEDAAEVIGILADDLENAHRLEQWAAVDLVATFARDENIDADAVLAAARAEALKAPVGAVTRFFRRVKSWPRSAAAALRLPWLASKPPVKWLVWLVRRAKSERAVDGLLGVLVFVPLLVTWFGLAQASRAYGRLLVSKDKDKAAEPFLQLWERGFYGNLGSFWRFGNVASLAVLFIGLLLLTSLYHAIARHRAQSAAEHLRGLVAAKTGELALALARAQVVVNGYRAVTPSDFTAALGSSAKRLRGMLKTAAEVEERAVEALRRTEQLSDGLGEAASRLTDASDRSAAASTASEQRVLQGVDLLQKAQEETGTLVGDVVRMSSDALRAAHDQAGTVVRDLVRQGAEGMAAVQTAGLAAVEETVRESREAVRSGVADLQSSQRAVVTAVEAARATMADATAKNTAAVGDVGDRLDGAGSQVAEAVLRLAAIQHDLNERTALAVTAADEVVRSLREVVQETTASIMQLGRVVGRWDEAAAHWMNAAQAVEQGARSADFRRPPENGQGPRANGADR